MSGPEGEQMIGRRFFSGFCLAVLLVLAASSPSFGEQHPNVLLILADDVGSPELSCFPDQTGPDVAYTPVLCGRLADMGVRFVNATVNPLCSPTRATLMTGRYA